MLHHGSRNYVSIFSLARHCFLILSLSIVISGSAFSSEWEEYISVCEHFTGLGKEDTTIRTSEGTLEIKEDFIAVINSMIEDGWQPFGGPYTFTFLRVSVCQVMVRSNPRPSRNSSLSELREKNAEEAREAAREITPEQCYTVPTATCLIALVQETAKLTEDEGARTMLFATVAVAQAQVGDAAAARRSLAKAPGIPQFNTPNPVTLLALSSLAIAQAQLGDAAETRQTIVEVLDMAKRLESPVLTFLALPEIAVAQAQIGDVAAARQTIDRVLEDAGQTENMFARTFAFALIAAAQAQVGDIAAGRQTIDRALHYVEQIENTGPRTFAFALIAAAQARVGDIAAGRQTITDALNHAGQIEDVVRDDLGLGLIAAARAQVGDVPGAVETARKILEKELKALAFARIATALASQD